MHTVDHLHPNFLPFLASIEHEATAGQGPKAAASLALETLTSVGKMIEMLCDRDDWAEAMTTGTGVGITDLVELAEHLGDRIETLTKQIQ